jgi:hypothetical protein
MALLCFGLTSAAQAAHRPSIVGLWNVHYFVGNVEIFPTYDQWHSDGLEFEVNSIAPGAVCQGTFKEVGGTVQLFHVIYTYDANGVFNGHIDETEANSVSQDGKTYGGTFDQKFYDLSETSSLSRPAHSLPRVSPSKASRDGIQAAGAPHRGSCARFLIVSRDVRSMPTRRRRQRPIRGFRFSIPRP